MRDNDLVEDFTLRPVPVEETISGLKIGIVLIALGMTLPIFSLGSQIVLAQGLLKGAVIMILGCGITALVGLATSLIGARVRVSTYVILTAVFGEAGGKLLNLMLAIILIGWFANVADMLGVQLSLALMSLYGLAVPAIACTTVALVLMTLTGIFGFKIMERFASVIVPVLLAFMLYVIYLSLARGDVGVALLRSGDGSLTVSQAVSAVLGSVILAGVLAPDFTRYARDEKAASRSVLALAVGYPCIMLLAAVPALILQSSDTMDIMVKLGLPSLALVVLALATWSSNTGNLYSSTLTLATVFPKRPIWQLGLVGFCCAWIASFFNASTYFVPFLVWLGIAAIPIAGVYVSAYFLLGAEPGKLVRRPVQFRLKNLAAWFFGTIVGCSSVLMDGFVIPAPALEGLVASILAFVVFNYGQIIGKSVPRSPPHSQG